jgi:hypothetical protein
MWHMHQTGTQVFTASYSDDSSFSTADCEARLPADQHTLAILYISAGDSSVWFIATTLNNGCLMAIVR